MAGEALLPSLSRLTRWALKEAAHNCRDLTLRAQVFEAAASLADLILTDAQYLDKSSHTQHIFERMRREAIQPFMDEGEVERAAVLAEKFKDFELLIAMCVQNEDLDRLYSYIDKYLDEGMAEMAFSWLAQQGGAHSASLVRSVAPRYGARARAWLALAPVRAPLLALYLLHSGEAHRAAPVLASMAQDETESVNRMTTMGSMAKLCLLASEESPSAEGEVGLGEAVERVLSLGAHHAALPPHLKLHHGLDQEDSAVHTPEELVQMYIDSEGDSLTEYDYKKALDLTDFVQDMEKRDDLRLQVWCSCILKDDWSSCRMDSPTEELRQKTFFRLVDLVRLMGGDVEALLPPLADVATSPRLAALASSPRFRFLLQFAYDYLAPGGEGEGEGGNPLISQQAHSPHKLIT